MRTEVGLKIAFHHHRFKQAVDILHASCIKKHKTTTYGMYI